MSQMILIYQSETVGFSLSFQIQENETKHFGIKILDCNNTGVESHMTDDTQQPYQNYLQNRTQAGWFDWMTLQIETVAWIDAYIGDVQMCHVSLIYDAAPMSWGKRLIALLVRLWTQPKWRRKLSTSWRRRLSTWKGSLNFCKVCHSHFHHHAYGQWR